MNQADVLVIQNTNHPEGEVVVFELLSFKSLITSSVAANDGLYIQNKILKKSYITYSERFKDVMHYHLRSRKNEGVEVQFIDLKYEKNEAIKIKIPFSSTKNGIVNIFTTVPTIANQHGEIKVNWQGVEQEQVQL